VSRADRTGASFVIATEIDHAADAAALDFIEQEAQS